MEVLSSIAEASIPDVSMNGGNRITIDSWTGRHAGEDDVGLSRPTESDKRVDVGRQVTISGNSCSGSESESCDGSREVNESSNGAVGSVDDALGKSPRYGASGSRSETDELNNCSSQNHSDDDDGSGVFLEGDSSHSSLDNGNPNRSREIPVQYPEDGQVFLGHNDLGDYLHEFEGDMENLSRENWNALTHQSHTSDRGPVADADHLDTTELVEQSEPENGPALEYLMGDKVQVRGTGRPDLDDAEDDCGSGAPESTSQVLNSSLLRGDRTPTSGESDVEDASNENGVGLVRNSSQIASSVLSEIREMLDGPDLDRQGRTSKHAHSELGPLSSQISSDEEFESQGGAVENTTLIEGDVAPNSRIARLSVRQAEAGKQWRSSDAFSMSSEDQDEERQPAMWSESLHLKSDSHPSTRPSEGLEPENSHLSSDSASKDSSSSKPALYEPLVGPGKDISRRSLGDKPRPKKGAVVQLGSKEAEELLQMDPSKLGRAVFTQMRPQSTSSTARDQERVRSLDWSGAVALGPDEVSRYVEALEVKETYIDTVLDMEDILFGAEDGSGARPFQGGKPPVSGAPRRPARDGSVSASTSSEGTWREGTELASNLPSEVDWIEVIGAFQKRGGASLGDRVVGLKEHTVYRIKVNRGGNEWEIQRRYRDFVVLHNQLLQLFSHRDKVKLPGPWDQVKAESRKLFGNTSPGVVEKRSDLIHFCLQSLLKAGPPLSTATPLLRFLFPSKEVSWSMEGGWQLTQKAKAEAYFESDVPQQGETQFPVDSTASNSTSIAKSAQDQNDGFQTSVFGKTIRLVVQIHKKKTLKQQLQAQHYTCAGCYKDLESAIGLVPEIVQNLGWSGPRYCEYSGQLFCSTCHLNEMAIIPARVLQQWDFVPRPVSQLVKAYLDSIYDKPMLCVSAVNPFLYARVPILAHVTELRRTLNKMLGCIRCPARSRFLTILGPRCYLLENNDFFALRDLADFSRGAFAVLPGYMQAMSLKMSRHIIRDCSTCQELGDVCGAGNSCHDPLDVIYPHQEKDITRCRACHIPYHTECFYKCQKRCSCTKDRQSARTPASSRSGIDTVPSGGYESDRSSSLIMDGDEPLTGRAVSAAPSGETLEKPKRSFFGTLLGSREGNSSDSQVGNSNSLTLNMRQIPSGLDL